ncbi:MAG: dioxygenase [Chloroflexi bacterium]|nr:dioxygenase [Chloroflexota bacterium]
MGNKVWRASLVVLAAVLSACGTATAPQAAAVPVVATALPSLAPVVATVTTQPAATSRPAVTLAPQPAVTVAPTSAAAYVPPFVNCATRAPATLEQTEGPYYKANPPQRASLIEPGIPGDRFVVTGYVMTVGCTPIPNARVDFWQADGNGSYDNSGYKLRGYQITDAKGLYRLETVYPGLYPGRTRHIHVKVNAPNGPILTTQIYFPNEPANQSDGIFNAALLTTLVDTPGAKTAVFYFLLAS